MALYRLKIEGGDLRARGDIFRVEGQTQVMVVEDVAVRSDYASNGFTLERGVHVYAAEVVGQGEGNITLVYAKSGTPASGPKPIKPMPGFRFRMFAPF